MERLRIFLAVLSGLLGAGGVAAGAAAAHVAGAGLLDTASRYALVHAAALMAVALAAPASRLVLVPAALIAIGSLLFSGDLALRALWAAKLFPMAAPAGGLLLMGGWAALGLGSAIYFGMKARQN